jgi:predicted nucleotidyltransferase
MSGTDQPALQAVTDGLARQMAALPPDAGEQTRHSILHALNSLARLDAVYLYGSRARQMAREDSDWDIAVLFSDYETCALTRLLRPQILQAESERILQIYEQISVVDLEAVPIFLQYSILTGAVKWFDRGVPHVRRVEQGIFSTWEKDYERYCV